MSDDIMQRFWIVKRAPVKDERSNTGQKLVTGDYNYVWHDQHEAERKAKALAKKERTAFVVLESIKCYDVCDVVEVEIEN